MKTEMDTSLRKYRVTAPESVQATIPLPASKSISNRALILHALSGGSSTPANLSDCDDTQVMIRALNDRPEVIDIMAAGTAMRFLTAYLCVTPGTHILTGTQRMQQRPIRLLVDALRELGAGISYVGNEGFPPLRITGDRLEKGEITLAGNVSSQYISALLMIGAVLPKGLVLHLTGDIISRPYIELTLMLMRHFGAQTSWTSERDISVLPGGYHDTPFTIESDWSAASYWYQILALSACRPRACRSAAAEGYIELEGLFPHSGQGDSRGAEVFARLGIVTEYTERGVRIRPTGSVAERIEEDMVDIPDLAQTFAVTCCLMGVPFRFTGLQSLRIKETDRIAALINELHKIGYVVHAEADSVLWWDGERCPAQARPVIDTYEDHRMAMAFAPACLVLPQPLCIACPEVVSKSYPRYWEHLQMAGFHIEEM